MSLLSYLKDKLIEIVIILLLIALITILLIAFNINAFLIVFISSTIFMLSLTIFLYEFYRKKNFYDKMDKSLKNLDKKYYISEIIDRPNFLEGALLYDYIYDIDKSYIEKLNNYKYLNQEFIEYIELWCHEIKTPIATTKLILENRNENDILEEIDKIEQYVEQVLYYSRSGNVDKDYIVFNVNLKDVINEVIRKNKKDFINKKIKVTSLDNDIFVKSDSKWLEFIINQIVTNSIKYSKNENAKLVINATKNKENVILTIEDNGIGINEDELSRVFDKGFTGSNGRKKYSSTGIGLYLCKKLCNKLGHNIIIGSKLDESTTVTIIFPESSMYKESLTEM